MRLTVRGMTKVKGTRWYEAGGMKGADVLERTSKSVNARRRCGEGRRSEGWRGEVIDGDRWSRDREQIDLF